MDSTIQYALPQLLGLAAVIAAGLIIVAARLYRQRDTAASGGQRNTPAPAKLVYHDAPTVRFVEAQRVDRMRKIVKLTTGAHVDLLESGPGLEPRFRVTLRAVGRSGDAEHALIGVQFGGARLSCGPLVEELGFNEFRVPKAGREEPRSALFHYHEKSDALDFMRIKVRACDPDSGTAELDVMQVSGHWPQPA